MSRGWLSRRRGVELLDLPATSAAVRAAAMRDLERSNRFFGATAAMVGAVRPLVRGRMRPTLLLDVGTGTGDIASRVRTVAPETVTVIGVDRDVALATAARARLDGVAAGDAVALPFRDASVDIATCSQVLHHFFDADLRRVIGELHRVSRGHVVVCDIRRSLLAAAGFWVASVVLRFHPVTRRDGVTSVFRGFTRDELRALVEDVTGVTPHVRRGIFWRLTATWAVRPDRLSAS